LISATTLSVKHMHVALDLVRVNGGSLVVIGDNNLRSYFKDHYDLDVAHCIGTSVQSIFSDLQAVYGPQKPRVLNNKSLCSVNLDPQGP